MAGWKKVSSKTKTESVQQFLANVYKNNSKVDPTDLSLAIVALGVGVIAAAFTKYMSPKMAKLLNAAGVGLSVASLTSLFLANPNNKRLQQVLNDCAKYNGGFIRTTTEVWEYVGHSGNNTTWETRTNYYWY